ncbi:hypothetical protein F5Y13DRAFT_195468 [Hypoxylon sp. FL1857]|nr:hypothetical protein F5Y13DRAFT_195468 [Hypoxylon sp. FL1857]
MPSVKNPNGPSKNRLAARAAKARKANQKRSAGSVNKSNRVTKADEKRGARSGILPTSGPNAALSSKKRRKLERKMGYALKRKMEAEGEVEMKDVPEEEDGKTTKTTDEEMAVDDGNIS